MLVQRIRSQLSRPPKRVVSVRADGERKPHPSALAVGRLFKGPGKAAAAALIAASSLSGCAVAPMTVAPYAIQMASGVAKSFQDSQLSPTSPPYILDRRSAALVDRVLEAARRAGYRAGVAPVRNVENAMILSRAPGLDSRSRDRFIDAQQKLLNAGYRIVVEKPTLAESLGENLGRGLQKAGRTAVQGARRLNARWFHMGAPESGPVADRLGEERIERFRNAIESRLRDEIGFEHLRVVDYDHKLAAAVCPDSDDEPDRIVFNMRRYDPERDAFTFDAPVMDGVRLRTGFPREFVMYHESFHLFQCEGREVSRLMADETERIARGIDRGVRAILQDANGPQRSIVAETLHDVYVSSRAEAGADVYAFVMLAAHRARETGDMDRAIESAADVVRQVSGVRSLIALNDFVTDHATARALDNMLSASSEEIRRLVETAMRDPRHAAVETYKALDRWFPSPEQFVADRQATLMAHAIVSVPDYMPPRNAVTQEAVRVLQRVFRHVKANTAYLHTENGANPEDVLEKLSRRINGLENGALSINYDRLRRFEVGHTDDFEPAPRW